MSGTHKQKGNRRRSLLGRAIQRIGVVIRQIRKHWIVSLGAFVVLILATASQFLYQLFKDRNEDLAKGTIQTGFAVLMHTESHGHGTLEVVCSDPKERPPADIDLAIDWRIMNIGNTNNLIVAYSVVVKSGDRLVRLRRIVVQSPHYLLRHHDGIVEYTDISNTCFDNVAHSRVLTPRDSVGGWVFFKADFQNDHRFSIDRIHVYIVDQYSKLHVIVPKRIAEDEYNQLTEGTAKTTPSRKRVSSGDARLKEPIAIIRNRLRSRRAKSAPSRRKRWINTNRAEYNTIALKARRLDR